MSHVVVHRTKYIEETNPGIQRDLGYFDKKKRLIRFNSSHYNLRKHSALDDVNFGLLYTYAHRESAFQIQKLYRFRFGLTLWTSELMKVPHQEFVPVDVSISRHQSKEEDGILLYAYVRMVIAELGTVLMRFTPNPT